MNPCLLFASIVSLVIASTSPAAPNGDPRPAAASRILHLNLGAVDTSTLTNLKANARGDFSRQQAYVVQFDGPLTPERRARVENAGIKLREYLPANAYVAELGGVAPAVLQQFPEIAFVGPFQNSWKLDPQLGRMQWQTAERRALAASGKTAAIVTLFEGREPGAVVRVLQSIDGTVIHYVTPIGPSVEISATIPTGRVGDLAALADVHYVEEAGEFTLRNSTTRWIVQSNVTNVTPLYDNGIHGEDQVVGVMDGKLNVNHCSFSDVNPIGPLHRKILAYNTSLGSDFHGTHVCGTAAGDNGVDDNTRGIAYLAKLVFDDIPSFTDTAMYNSLELHHNQTARMHTNSWGNDGTTAYNSLTRGIDRFSYDYEDSLVFFAVTNTGTLKNPENAKNLIAVGASQDTPNQGNFCSGGAGPTADGRRKPEIFAPGCNTQSSQSSSACSTTGLTGTSMASPAVTGTGSLVRQYYTDGYYPSGTATPVDALTPTAALVKATMINASVNMAGIGGYPSNGEGWGRILAGDALYFPGDARELGVLADVRNADGLVNADPDAEYNVNVLSTGEQLRITLVWTDPPASASTGSGLALINDLDLEVEAPGGATYLGNVFSGGVSVSGGSADALNNVEQVHVNSPTIGSWTVRVRPAAVNLPAQGYALIATGDVQLAPPDCNENGTPDDEDIALGNSDDCNANGRPDECEPQDDCNANGTLDFCDLFLGTSPDCNDDDIPDECQLAANDCNANGTPDDCEPQADCNANGTLDFCDLFLATSPDCNANAIPDECELSGESDLLDAGFESGLSAGWSATGLWHVTGACPRPNTCDPANWAYYGIDANCNFNTGAQNAGVLTAPAVTIPTGASSAVLTYCSAYAGEAGNSNASGFDWAWLSVNNTEIDDVSQANDQNTWETRTENLLAYAGQTITLRWHFDSVDQVLNSEFGWQVDNIVLEVVVPGAGDCNSNGTPDDCDLSSLNSPDCNANGTPDECESPPVDCPCDTVPGDMDGNSIVDGADMAMFETCLLDGNPATAGCACADLDTSGMIDDLDMDAFVLCLLGLECP
jgi:hypothetical protein